MVVTLLWWTIRVSITMDTKRKPVRHLVVMATILVLVIFAYFYISNAPLPTRINTATRTVIAQRRFDQLMESVKTSEESEYPQPIQDQSKTTEVKLDDSMDLVPLATLQEPPKKPKRCSQCFQPRIVPVIHSRYLCRPTEIAGNVDIVTLITSHVANRQRRDAIRQTWASTTKQNTAILRHIFILGLSQEPDLNRAIQEENNQHLDILQFDFLDSYSNLTLKTLGALKWAMQRCSGAKHVVKTDDDMWLNLQRLLWVLPRYDLVKALGGYCLKNARPIRDPKSKWYVSYKTYTRRTYPPFCSGTGYVLEMSTVRDVLRVSPNVPYHPLEDVYIGLCLEELNYRVQSLPGFHNSFVHFDPCTYRRTVVTSHDVSEEMLHWAWESECNVHPFVIDQADSES